MVEMNGRLTRISDSLNKEVFQRLGQETITVFLVGASKAATNSLRDPVRKELLGKSYVRGFRVYYPEELFDELLSGKHKSNILELENMLAKSVHAVVILLESPGTYAELGAFANHEALRDKLVVVVNEKYRRSKGFIMLGPVRYVQKRGRNRVIYHDFESPDIEELGIQVRKAVQRIAKDVTIDSSVANPVAAQDFLLAAIYALEPVPFMVLRRVIETASAGTKSDADTITRTSVNILFAQGEIRTKVTQDEIRNKRVRRYHLTTNGLERLRMAIQLGNDSKSIQHSLDLIRINVLNWTLRRPIGLQV